MSSADGVLSLGGGCAGGCEQDAACAGCKEKRTGAGNSRIEWAETVASTRPSASPFWSVALLNDALFSSGSGGVSPLVGSAAGAAARDVHRAVSRLSGFTGRSGSFAPEVLASVQEDGETQAADGVLVGDGVNPGDGPCPPGQKQVFVQNPPGSEELGHWECSTPIECPPPQWAVWVENGPGLGGHWECSTNIKSLTEEPQNSDTCCCEPESVRIESFGKASSTNKQNGSYDFPPNGMVWDRGMETFKNVFGAHTGSMVAQVQTKHSARVWLPRQTFPVLGQAFKVRIKLNWSVSPVYAPCKLRWIETATRPNQSMRGVQTPMKPFDIYDYAVKNQKENLLNGVSLADWYYGVDQKRDVPATCPSSQEVVLYDFPFLQIRDHLPGEGWDSTVGKIEVEGGCPGSGGSGGGGSGPKILSAQWAQRIRIDQDGPFRNEGFAQFYEESSDGSSSGDENPAVPGRKIPEEHKYERWVEAIKKLWFDR